MKYTGHLSNKNYYHCSVETKKNWDVFLVKSTHLLSFLHISSGFLTSFCASCEPLFWCGIDDTWMSFLRPRDWEILIMEALVHVPGNEEKQQTFRITVSDDLPTPTACVACPDSKSQKSDSVEKNWHCLSILNLPFWFFHNLLENNTEYKVCISKSVLFLNFYEGNFKSSTVLWTTFF